MMPLPFRLRDDLGPRTARAGHQCIKNRNRAYDRKDIARKYRALYRRADSEMYCNLKKQKNIINMKKTLLTYCLNNAHNDYIGISPVWYIRAQRIYFQPGRGKSNKRTAACCLILKALLIFI